MFTEKLNKKLDGSVYVIEEEQIITDGKYEGYLIHDNVNRSSLKVYTGSKFTGDEISNVVLSSPSETPWKTLIKIFAEVEKVYIIYETHGDTVEADDINELQRAVIETKEDITTYKETGHIDGGTF